MKSLTGRTEVDAAIEPNGSVAVFIRRNGQTVHSFSIGREQDIPNGARLEADKKAGVINVFLPGDGDTPSKRIPIV